jgi:thymidylate synthase
MNNIDKQYIDLLQDILDNGVEKKDRTNTGTISVFGRHIRHKMSDGFPLITTKKMPFKTMVTELLWFLRGDTNIKYLIENGCNIWTGDAYKRYLNTYKGNFELDKEEFINAIKTSPEFAQQWGELGPIYGKQWRRILMPFDMMVIDQIKNLINDLKTNPDSRRLMVNAWNVGELDQMVLPPCHYGFQVYTRELSVVERMEYYGKHFMKETDSKTFDELSQIDYDKLNIPTRAISLMWNQRSCDVPLGIPMNIASYGLLLMMIADEVNMIPEELIGNLGDCHIYLNQMNGVKEQIGREPFELPTVHVRDGIHCLSVNDVILENYQSHPKIYFPLSN